VAQSYFQDTVTVSHRVHGLRSIDEQIQKDLLQLHAICLNLRKARAQTGLDRNPTPLKIAMQEAQNLLDHHVWFEREPFVIVFF
jgi:hypothetical protein